ncbi:MAG: type II secretion system protein [Pseudomonadota bacterium]
MCPCSSRSTTFRQGGFTLIEMIVVMVVMGILGGMIAIFISAPVQGYVDSERRATLNYIADSALNRITHELRLALPNSGRVQGALSGAGVCSGTETCYLEFLPIKDGGRYLAQTDCASSAVCGEVLSFASSVSSVQMLGQMPTFAAGDLLVVDNLNATDTLNPNNAYNNNASASNRSSWVSTNAATHVVTIDTNQFPSPSPTNSFQVITTPVSYVCAPVSGGTGGTLTRYWGYPIASAQPIAPAALTAVHPGALLASNVSTCRFSPLSGNGLISMQLTIAENGESVNLYGVAHIGNVP